jgi:stage III sporulation protein AA
VVDTNHELKFDLNNHALTCDFLVGYPKAYGIDLAIRYFNPEYLICDELGGYDECEKLTELLHCGVPMIASAHADSFQGLLKRKNLRSLINNNAFDTAIKIHRQNNLFQYEIKSLSSICDS